MTNWPRFMPMQMRWPADFRLPDGWSVWLHIRVSQEISPPDVAYVPSIVFNDPPIMQNWEYELDDYVNSLDGCFGVRLSDLIESRDPVDFIARTLAQTLIRGSCLTVVRADNAWRLELDTEVGYYSQVTIERLPWDN